MSSEELGQQIDFVKESVNYNIGIIQYIDQKTHLLLATIGILIPLIFELIGNLPAEFNLEMNSLSYNIGLVSYYCTIAMLFISFIFCINVIVARVTSEKRNYFFGLDIVKDDFTSYEKLMKNFRLENQLDSYIDQAYILGRILKTKIRSYNIALLLILCAIEFLVSAFLLISISAWVIAVLVFLGDILFIIVRWKKFERKKLFK